MNPYPNKPWITQTSPFEATVELRGGLGKVAFKDPPQQRLKDVAKQIEALGKNDAHKDAAYIRAYVESAEGVEGMPAKEAKLGEWAEWLMALPNSQAGRLSDGVAAVSGQLDAEAKTDESEGN